MNRIASVGRSHSTSCERLIGKTHKCIALLVYSINWGNYRQHSTYLGRGALLQAKRIQYRSFAHFAKAMWSDYRRKARWKWMVVPSSNCVGRVSMNNPAFQCATQSYCKLQHRTISIDTLQIQFFHLSRRIPLPWIDYRAKLYSIRT